MQPLFAILTLVTLVLLSLLFVFVVSLFATWLRAWLSGAPVPSATLAAMKLRRMDTKEIVNAYIAVKKANLDIELSGLAALSLAGGHPTDAVEAMNEARRAGIDLSWNDVWALDLAGRDLVQNVRECAARGETRVLLPGEAYSSR